MAMSGAAQIGSELRRRTSAAVTHQVLLRRGNDLGMWLGCGYPKSGTVWLCHLMASALEVPYPQNYEMPIMMKSVVHGHWNYDERFPPAIYIVRDGRDVLTSLFFYLTRSGKPQRNVLAMKARALRGRGVGEILGAGSEADQLIKLLEMEQESPTGASVSWAEHVRQWSGQDNVALVRYEDLLDSPASTLTSAFETLGKTVDPRVMDAAVQLHDFSVRTGRARGVDDPTSFRRAGVAGGWRKHFTRDVAEAFDRYAGSLLVDLGYEQDRSWVNDV